jgi:hypothetical protein
MYNKRISGQPYQAEMIRLSTELLVAKKKAQEDFYVRSYETKVDAGQSSISTCTLHGEKEIQRVVG